MRAWMLMVVAGVVASASTAHAECALRTAASPNDAPLPLRGSVFAYVDSYEPLPTEISWTTGTGTTQVTRLSSSIVRVDYAGDAGAILLVNRSRYTLSARPPAQRVPRVVSMSRAAGSWTCSSYNSLSISMDAATTAVHARWTRAGKVSDYWVVPTGGGIELGKVNCGSTTLPPSELDAGGNLELFAVFVDGSEHAITEQPMFLIGTMFPNQDVRENRMTDAESVSRRVALSFAMLLVLFTLVTAGTFAPRVAFTARAGGTVRAVARLPRASIHCS